MRCLLLVLAVAGMGCAVRQTPEYMAQQRRLAAKHETAKLAQAKVEQERRAAYLRFLANCEMVKRGDVADPDRQVLSLCLQHDAEKRLVEEQYQRDMTAASVAAQEAQAQAAQQQADAAKALMWMQVSAQVLQAMQPPPPPPVVVQPVYVAPPLSRTTTTNCIPVGTGINCTSY